MRCTCATINFSSRSSRGSQLRASYCMHWANGWKGPNGNCNWRFKRRFVLLHHSALCVLCTEREMFWFICNKWRTRSLCNCDCEQTTQDIAAEILKNAENEEKNARKNEHSVCWVQKAETDLRLCTYNLEETVRRFSQILKIGVGRNSIPSPILLSPPSLYLRCDFY